MFSKRPVPNKVEGQLIMWRKSLFSFIEKHEVPFNFDPDSEIYDNTKTSLITVLKSCKTETPFFLIVASAHLFYGARRGDIKLGQTNLILNCISEIKRYYDFIGMKTIVIFCGDFNSSPSSGIFRFITEGSYDCKSMQRRAISGQEEARIRFGQNKQLVPELDCKCKEILTKAAYLSPTTSLDVYL